MCWVNRSPTLRGMSGASGGRKVEQWSEGVLTKRLHVILKCFGGGLLCLAIGKVVANPVGPIGLALGFWLLVYSVACFGLVFLPPVWRRTAGNATERIPESLEVRCYAARQANDD